MASPFVAVPWPGGPTDTARHGTFCRYTDANFSEVAPDRISPLAWSVLGPPMERAFRDLYTALVPSLRPVFETDRYAFVGYLSGKPYHCVDGLLKLVPYTPSLEGADVARLYLQDLDTTAVRGGDASRAHQARVVVGAVRRYRDLDRRLAATESLLVDAEAIVHDGLPLTPATARWVRRALNAAWSCHIDATCYAALLVNWTERIGNRALPDDWPIARIEFISPEEVLWQSLGWVPDMVSTAFLAHEFYEIGDVDPAWAELASGTGRRESPMPLRSSSHAAPWTRGIRDVLLDRLSPLVGGALRTVATQARQVLEDRERAKALAMRAQHVARVLAAGSGATTEGGWSGCTFEELAVGGAASGAARLAVLRERMQTPLPRSLRLVSASDAPASAAAAALPAPLPVGVSPGFATGTVFHPGAPCPERGVLVVTHADSPLLAEMTQAVAVVCERGSMLSHVSIICRSLGIPAVVNVPRAVDELLPGTIVDVDGTAGFVELHPPADASSVGDSGDGP